MSNSVEGRVVIVTGAGRGIGRSIAEGLAQAGARVVIADIAADTAESTAAEIREAGGQAIGLAVDVTDRASTRALIARTAAEHGRLDAMFNNAGIAQVKPFNDITEEDWHRVMDVNAMGVLIGIQEAAKQFIAQGGGGKIVNTASIAGKQGYEPLAHY
ncbi:SDR family NAD(P)-dependent oxidoreductase, partial [Paracoccus sp. PXZ]